MNKLEQVFSDGHQMSLTGGPCAVRSHFQGKGRVVAVHQDHMSGGSGDMYSEVKCIMDNGHMGPCSLSHEQTDTTENITFLQPHWQTVISIERSSSGSQEVLSFYALLN